MILASFYEEDIFLTSAPFRSMEDVNEYKRFLEEELTEPGLIFVDVQHA